MAVSAACCCLLLLLHPSLLRPAAPAAPQPLPAAGPQAAAPAARNAPRFTALTEQILGCCNALVAPYHSPWLLGLPPLRLARLLWVFGSHARCVTWRRPEIVHALAAAVSAKEGGRCTAVGGEGRGGPGMCWGYRWGKGRGSS